MEGFDCILNWRLLRGSHTFPGNDGGTCINEAAVVAAGFEYRRVRTVKDMPSCFSRPTCELAMFLNDHSNNQQRQRLLPFVTRLACADSEEVERQRQRYISKRGRPFTMKEGVEILEGALAIGRQADPTGFGVVEGRLRAAREAGGFTAPTSEKPFLATVKKLLPKKALTAV